MTALRREDLFSLEEYARIRNDFRREVMAHKRDRKVCLGPNATLYFEDLMTMKYQVQEMLRVERIFEEEGIREELEAYNPLIPDGNNLKATFMLEYPEIDERRQALAALKGVEDRVWVQVDGHDKVWAIADEDLERESEEKTSSVHFLRFELDQDMVAALKAGGALSMGIDHQALQVALAPLPENNRQALVADLA
ncbi:MAG: DUF3501 family protein [Gammaproteobacteria bacterium]